MMASARSADLTRLAALVDTGQLRPLLGGVFDRARATQAHQRVEGGSSGKVVIDMTGEHPDDEPRAKATP